MLKWWWRARVLSPNARARVYRCAPGFWGFGFGHTRGAHWYAQFGPWVLTTEPE